MLLGEDVDLGVDLRPRQASVKSEQRPVEQLRQGYVEPVVEEPKSPMARRLIACMGAILAEPFHTRGAQQVKTSTPNPQVSDTSLPAPIAQLDRAIPS